MNRQEILQKALEEMQIDLKILRKNIAAEAFVNHRFDNMPETIDKWIERNNEALSLLTKEPEETITDKLKKYFQETPKEQVLKDWESTKEYDKVNSPKVLGERGEEETCKCTEDPCWPVSGRCVTCNKLVKRS